MSSRAPIQVPEELKNKVDSMKDQFRCKTQYEVIQKLIFDFHQNEKQKIEDYEQRLQENKRRDLEDINVGENRKNELNSLKQTLGLKNLNQVIDLLLFHFDSSDDFKRETMMFLCQLKG